MASTVTYTGNGVLTDYTVPFGFLHRDHVSVSVNGVLTSDPASAYTLTWVSDALVRFSPAPVQGTTIVIWRATPDVPMIDFTDGSTLTASDLDASGQQGLYRAQEVEDTLLSYMGDDMVVRNTTGNLLSNPDCQVQVNPTSVVLSGTGQWLPQDTFEAWYTGSFSAGTALSVAGGIAAYTTGYCVALDNATSTTGNLVVQTYLDDAVGRTLRNSHWAASVRVMHNGSVAHDVTLGLYTCGVANKTKISLTLVKEVTVNVPISPLAPLGNNPGTDIVLRSDSALPGTTTNGLVLRVTFKDPCAVATDIYMGHWQLMGVPAALTSDVMVPSYLPLTFHESRQRCERYVQMSYTYGTAPGTVTNAGAIYTTVNASDVADGFVRSFQRNLRAPMMGSSVKPYSPTTGTAERFRNLTTAADITTGVGTNNANPHSTGYPGVVSGTINDGDAVSMHWVADGRPTG